MADPGFPEDEMPTIKVGVPTYYFCPISPKQKLHENAKKLDPEGGRQGGARPPPPPPPRGSANGHYTVFNFLVLHIGHLN